MAQVRQASPKKGTVEYYQSGITSSNAITAECNRRKSEAEVSFCNDVFLCGILVERHKTLTDQLNILLAVSKSQLGNDLLHTR